MCFFGGGTTKRKEPRNVKVLNTNDEKRAALPAVINKGPDKAGVVKKDSVLPSTPSPSFTRKRI